MILIKDQINANAKISLFTFRCFSQQRRFTMLVYNLSIDDDMDFFNVKFSTYLLYLCTYIYLKNYPLVNKTFLGLTIVFR